MKVISVTTGVIPLPAACICVLVSTLLLFQLSVFCIHTVNIIVVSQLETALSLTPKPSDIKEGYYLVKKGDKEWQRLLDNVPNSRGH